MIVKHELLKLLLNVEEEPGVKGNGGVDADGENGQIKPIRTPKPYMPEKSKSEPNNSSYCTSCSGELKHN